MVHFLLDNLAAHLHRSSAYPSSHFVLSQDPNSVMDGYHLLQCQGMPEISADLHSELTATGMQVYVGRMI